MINYDYLIKHSNLFPSVIGIKYWRFKILLKKFSKELRKAEKQKAYSFERSRLVGGGRKVAKSLDSDGKKLFFVLFYYKTYPTFVLAQALFELDESNLLRWKVFLEKVLLNSIDYQLKLPEVKVKHLDQLLLVCPNLKECLIDASETPINRPKSGSKQKRYYSGKKKRHTVKNQILVSPRTRKILHVSKTVEGKRHDKKLAEEDPVWYKFPPGSLCIGDSGYQGLDETNSKVKVVTPKKKPKGKELTISEKKNNTSISSIRTPVEHPFAWMKHFHILKNQFRGRVTQADTPFRTIAALYNFNLAYK